ncbi:MAG: PAS domain-containing protein [Burkholderiales bacterium]|nr:PAS domain-containing protein [Burkholderiales bacterium]
MLTRNSLLAVADAGADPAWQAAMQQPHGWLSFLGVPVNWPSGAHFAVLCAGERQARSFAQVDHKLLWQMKEAIEGDLRIIHYSRELEQRKTALEQELQERHGQLQLLLDSTAEAIFGMDQEGRCTFSNRACMHLLGLGSADELIGQHIYERLQPMHAGADAAPVWDARLRDALASGQAYHGDDATFLRRDATRIPVEFWAYPQWRGGAVVGIVVTFLDISERKAAQAQLYCISERLQLATRAGGIGIWDWDIRENVLVWDDSMYQLYGIERDTFNGAYEAWQRALHPDDREQAEAQVAQALHGDGNFTAEFRIIRPDGTVHYIAAEAQTYFDGAAQPLRMVGVNYDVSERKLVEEQIRQINSELERRVQDRTRQLEEMVQQLETFSYTVSHDLRAPLRAIDGYSCVLEEDYAPQLDATAQGYLKRVRAGVQLIGHLIDDLLALAKVGRATVKRAPTDLSAIVRDVIADLRAGEPEREVECKIADVEEIACDTGLARIIVQNLVQNAWKYSRNTEAARIEFGECTYQDKDCFFVRDNGIGFAPEHATSLFRPFSRLENALEFEGSGIGLATVKQALAKHGGHIWAESDLGKGSCFYFNLGESRH